MTVHDVESRSGVGLLEIYDLEQQSTSPLANISARGFVGAEDEVLIGGFMVAGSAAEIPLLVRAMGPSLGNHDVSQPLGDPVLELRDVNGGLVAWNDNWPDAQETELRASALAPGSGLEPALLVHVGPGAYTAIVRGRESGATGVAVLEVYRLQ